MRCFQIVATAAALGLSFLSAAAAAEKPPPQRAEPQESRKQPARRLAIVAPQRFHAALEEFVRHKSRLLPTELVSLEKVLQTTVGEDDPERLKRFLYVQWREHRLGYALLVGDVDAMPVRYMVLDRVTPTAFDYAFYPSDLYYADLAGPDGVGLVVHAGHGTDTSWQDCFSLRSLDRLTNADRLPVMISAGCSTAAFAPLAPYAAYVDADGGEHRGTDRGEVFRGPPPPPAPYQKGRYNPTGLGEQLLRRGRNGAVAYIGCNTGSQPCALTLVEGFVIALADARQPRLGDCWTSAVAYYYDKERLEKLVPTPDWYPPSVFFQGMKFMLFGDPTLRLPAPP